MIPRVVRLVIVLSVVMGLAMPLELELLARQSRILETSAFEGWQQLTCSHYGYALKLPVGASARLYEPVGILQIAIEKGVDPLFIRVYDNPNELTAKDWVSIKLAAKHNRSNTEPPIHVLRTEQLQIGDQTCYALYMSGADQESQSVFLDYSSRIYEIGFPTTNNPNDPQSEYHYQLYLQILSSLQLGRFSYDSGFVVIETQHTEGIPDLPVPSFNQLDGNWKCDQLGTCTCGNYGMCPSQPSWTTIGSDGCAVTSLSMVFSYYQPDFANPAQLNTCLRDHSGYSGSGCGQGDCFVVWSMSQTCRPQGVMWNGMDQEQIDSDLQSGRPVIAKIPGDPGFHFVVIIGKRDDGRYSIMDPWGGIKRDIDPGAVLGVRRYQGSSPPPPPPNAPPNTPLPQAPPDWHVSYDGLAPTLCWNNPGDPNNDPVEFYAEVYDSAVNANSGWISNTCWRPGELDGHYYNYQWHVKARDVPHHAESGWSTTRHFSIEAPNESPSITFDTANGDPFASGAIESQERNWTFQGTASDPEGLLDRIEFRCDNCDNSGSGPGQTYGNNWSLSRTGMAGLNDVYFVAFDDAQGTSSRHLDLKIDLSAPSTNHNFVGTMGENDWFISPVEVQLQAADGCTGRACVGVQEIRYRLDGGAWQTHSGDLASFTVSSDGYHTVEYYAVDRVGNVEGQHQAGFKVDATPPTAPGAATETHGVISEQWQRDYNDPKFTWVPANDTTSGLWYYRVNWHDTLDVTPDPAYDPLPVGTGSYELSAQAVDQAGNVGPEGAFFTFRYDGTPPHAPAITNNDGVASGVWQNVVRTADFSWPVPYDEGSGIAGYNVYWGPIITGTCDVLTLDNGFVDPTPICAEDKAAIYYLRTRSQDNVGWTSEWVDFALAYDGAPPTATLIANYGLTVTHQTNIHLDIVGEDEGSGVSQMRLSNDKRNWTEWLDYTEEVYWEIPAIGRRFHPIYLQLIDEVGNLSAIVSDVVYLEVNVPRPRSENFWLWDDMMTSGGTVITSTNYNQRVSIGQPLDSPESTSDNYTVYGGFQAGVLADPTTTPTYTSYFQMGYVVASGGTCTPTLQSGNFWMYGTLGQPAEMLTITSTNYLLRSGFWGGVATDLEAPELPPPPPPPPPPACEFFSLTINNDALFTRQAVVTLTMCGPDPLDVMLSNQQDFAGATWQPYTETIAWTLEVSGSSVQPRFVYARFRDQDGAVYGTFFDHITYDPNAPVGSAAFDIADFLSSTGVLSGPYPLRVVNQNLVDLFLNAGDDSSGLAQMQVSGDSGFEPLYHIYLPLVSKGYYGQAVGQVSADPLARPAQEPPWQPYSAIVPITFVGDGVKTVYVRLQDYAGNVSHVVSSTLIVDTTPPVGLASVKEGTVGSEAVSVTLNLAAWDNLVGVDSVRISRWPSFTNTIWLTYTPQVAVPVSYSGEDEPVLYIQFRDEAGNVSEVYTTSYLVDTAPPILYVGVEPGGSLTRTVNILAYDELTGLGRMWLSNDPRMLENVVVMPYTSTVTWTFDERRIIWVALEDGVGNRTEPYPAYAGD